MRPLSWLREAFREADHPEPQPCPHQLETLRLRSQLAKVTVERNEAREAVAELRSRSVCLGECFGPPDGTADSWAELVASLKAELAKLREAS